MRRPRPASWRWDRWRRWNSPSTGFASTSSAPAPSDTEIDDNTQSQNREAAAVPVEFPEGQVPLTGGRPGTSADVAELILFLASDRSRHITGDTGLDRWRAIAAGFDRALEASRKACQGHFGRHRLDLLAETMKVEGQRGVMRLVGGTADGVGDQK